MIARGNSGILRFSVQLRNLGTEVTTVMIKWFPKKWGVPELRDKLMELGLGKQYAFCRGFITM